MQRLPPFQSTLSHPQRVPDVAVKVRHRVLGLIVLADLKVEVGACGHAGGAHGADHLPGRCHPLPL